MNNYHNRAVHVINLYRQGSVWGFDDSHLGLVFEPFVCGASEAIQLLVDSHPKLINKDTPKVIFGEKLGEFDAEINKIADEGSSATYELSILDMKHSLWLCPVLSRFFMSPPNKIQLKLID